MTRPKLATLKPRLQVSSTSRIPILTTKPGATERIRGRSWMETRKRIALAHGYRCAGCGCVWVPSRDQIDHKVPLEQGGSNDDSNLHPLCHQCHEAKTAAEAGKRARGF
jgi:5-methylcytosine-specific restriction endonuclease McrA